MVRPLPARPDSLNVAPIDAFIAAVRGNDVGAATRLLESHAELRRVLNDPLPGLPFGETILAPAVQEANGEMVDLLLRFGADVNSKSHWWAGGFGALDLCSPDFAPFLIERGAQLTAYSASRLGRMSDLERLVAGDSELVHQRGGDGQTPLHVAASVEVARFLVEHGAAIDALDVDHESTAVQYAIRDRQDVARFLIERGGRTDILAAAALGDLPRVQRFLDANPDSVRVSVTDEFFPMKNPRAGGSIYIWTLGRNKTAHIVAREFGHDDVFRLLIGRTPEVLRLTVACEVGDAATVERMLAARPNLAALLTEREMRALPAAAEANKIAAVRLMLGAGWPVDSRGPRGATALHWAAWQGNIEMVRTILPYGPSLDLEDGAYQSPPLGWALHGSTNGWSGSKGDYAATIDALLSAGATPPPTDGLDASDEVLDVISRYRGSGDAPTTEVD